MAAPYTSVTITGYNDNPPPDAGQQTEANRVKWSTIKTKLPDPLKTAIESINTNISAAIGKLPGGAGIVTSAGNYTVQAADQGKLVVITASGTLTTPDATSVTAPFVFAFKNAHSGDITLDGNGSQTIDGAATVTVPTGKGGWLFTDGTNWFTAGINWDTSVLPAGHLFGLTMSNAADTTNDITVAIGRCRDSTNTVDMVLASALTKQIDSSWAVGSAAGGRSSAGLADDTWHLFVIAQAGGAGADVLFHNTLDPSAEFTGSLAGYVYYRRIGSVVRLSNAILQFVQHGDEFWWKQPKRDNSGAPGATTAVSITLTLPTDIQVEARLNGNVDAATTVYISALELDDVAPSRSAVPGVTMGIIDDSIGAQFSIWTNTSAQVRSRSSTNDVFYLYTLGWRDPRGRDA